MNLKTTFRGSEVLFEGDLPILLRAFPQGTHITRAVLTLKPVDSQGNPASFHETFQIVPPQQELFGISVQEGTSSAIIDMNRRRTVDQVGLKATNVSGLQVDMGGTWLAINGDGSPRQPNQIFTSPTLSNGECELPDLTSQRLRFSTLDPSVGVKDIRIRTYPSNLTLRIGNLGPFWFKVGDLREAVTTPDFADILQAFFQRVQPVDGVFEVPLILHSDGLARLQLDLDCDFYEEQPMLDPQLSQVIYPYGCGGTPSAQPAQLYASLPLQAQALPGATSAQVFGRFEATRVVYDGTGPDTLPATLSIAPNLSAANPILLDKPTNATAIDLYVEAVDSTVTLQITVQEDVGGKPWGNSLLPEPITVKFDRPAAGGVNCVSAPLPSDFNFSAQEVYWLIINSAAGKANWCLRPTSASPSLQVTSDNGLSYRTYKPDPKTGPVVGVFRLRNQPAEFRQPIKVQVGDQVLDLNKMDALGKVDFTLNLPELADAINNTLDQAAQKAKVQSPGIANGDFSSWTKIDKNLKGPSAALQLQNAGGSALAVPNTGVKVYTGILATEEPQRTSVQLFNYEPQLSAADLLELSQTGSAGYPDFLIDLYDLAISPDAHTLFAYGLFSADSDNGFKIARQALDGDIPFITSQNILRDTTTFPTRGWLATSSDCQKVFVTYMDTDGPYLAVSPASDLSKVDAVRLDSAQAAPLQVARLRFFNGDLLGEIDVQAGSDNPQPTLEKVNQLGFSQYRPIPVDGFTIEQKSVPTALLKNLTQDQTLVLYHDPNQQGLAFFTLADAPGRNWDPGQCYIRFVNAVTGTTLISVKDDSNTITASVPLGTASFPAPVTPGTYTFTVSDDKPNVIDKLEQVSLTAGIFTTIYICGSLTAVTGTVILVEGDAAPRVGARRRASAAAAPAAASQNVVSVTDTLSYIDSGVISSWPLGLQLSMDGQRAYIATLDGIRVVNTQPPPNPDGTQPVLSFLGQAWYAERPTQLGNATLHRDLLGLAFSRDGSWLYALVVQTTNFQSTTELFINTSAPSQFLLCVIDPSLVERIFPAAGQTSSFTLEQATHSEIDLGNRWSDLLPALALTPDGERLLISMAYDTTQSQNSFNSRRSASSTLVNQANQILQVDLINQKLLDPISIPGLTVNLAATPDSRHAIARVVQLDGGLQNPRPFSILQVLINTFSYIPAAAYQLVTLDLLVWTADQWALTGGRVAPVWTADASPQTARLGAPNAVTGLSQTFPVQAGQSYDLSFMARASAEGAEATLFWLTSTCQTPEQVTIPIQVPDCGQGLKPHNLRVTAPQSAANAELRFRQPADGYTLLDDVSFRAPQAATSNGNFQNKVQSIDPVSQRIVSLPAGWTLEQANSPADSVLSHTNDNNILLTAPAVGPVSLSQLLSIQPGKDFVLRFLAYPSGKLSQKGNPSVQILWTGSQATPYKREITQQSFDNVVVEGKTPADASAAQLVFTQPPEGKLVIAWAIFSQPQPVDIPITFLSETPGQLTIISPVVAFDPNGSDRATQPGANLGHTSSGTPGTSGPVGTTQPAQPTGCQPTPPDDFPAPAGGSTSTGTFIPEPLLDVGHCPCCETVHFLPEPEYQVTDSGMLVLQGVCPTCHVPVMIYPFKR